MEYFDTIAAIASTIIAGAALWFSITESRAARRHDRLSVQPILADDVLIDPSAPRLGLFLKNTGLGPAKVIHWSLQVDDRPYRELGISNWSELSRHLGFAGDEIVYGYFVPDQVLPANESAELFSLDNQSYSAERARKIRQALRRLTITIKYQSIYKDETQVYEFRGTDYFRQE